MEGKRDEGSEGSIFEGTDLFKLCFHGVILVFTKTLCVCIYAYIPTCLCAFAQDNLVIETSLLLKNRI